MAQVVHGVWACNDQLWESEGQMQSHEAKVKSGCLAEVSFLTPLGVEQLFLFQPNCVT